MKSLSSLKLTEPGYFPAVVSYYKTKWETRSINPHYHDRMEIMYVTEGHCTVTVMEKEIALNPFQFILLDANVPHDLRISGGCAILNVEMVFRKRQFNGTDLATLASREPLLRYIAEANEPYFVIKDEGVVFRTLLNLYDELDVAKPDDPSTLLLLNYLLIRLGSAIRDELRLCTPDYSHVERACEYIKDHLCEKIKVGDIAKFTCINSAYLQRLFKKVKGKTIIDYINESRVILACNYLSRTEQNIAELALNLGFNSQQYFNYLFKHYLGMSPGCYRRERNGGAGRGDRVIYDEKMIAEKDLPEHPYIAKRAGQQNEGG